MKNVEGYPSFLRNLYQTKVGFGERFVDHQMSCEDGCILCSGIRKQIHKVEERASQNIAGLSGEQVMLLRQDINEKEKISSYYPSRTDIRLDTGALDRNVYLVLQSNNFSDTRIQHYFGINNHEWQQFKRREFPNWLSERDEILATEGVKALREFRRTHNVRRFKLGQGYFQHVDAQEAKRNQFK